MAKKDQPPARFIKIVSESNIEAIKTIETLFPEAEVVELKVNSAYDFRHSKVYTLRVHGIKKIKS